MTRSVMVGPYEVLGVIGHGASGWVGRARTPEGREVALKMIVAVSEGARHDSRGGALARFQREARVQGALGEVEGFVPLLDSGVTPQGAYIVMPLLTGGTLREKLHKGPLEVEDAVSLVRTIATALGSAHARGIVHRDLKPENVIFTIPGEEGRPLVADMGLAKHFRPDATGASVGAGLSKTGALLGTASYMAPEQLRDAKTAGPPADVFALGAILYECVAGSPAFEGEGLVEVMAKITDSNAASLESVRAGTPPWLAAVVRRALHRDPARRFATGAELAAALDGGKDGHDGATSATKTRLAVAGAVLALLAALGAGLALRGSSAEPTAASAPPAAAPPPSAAPAPPVALPELPSFCAPFRRTAKTVCVACCGDTARRHGAMVTSVRFSADGALGTSTSLDGTIRVWDLATDREVATFVTGVPVFNSMFLDGGRTVASGGNGNAIRFWDVASGKETGRITTDQGTLFGLHASPDEKLLVATFDKGPVRVWELPSRTLVTTFSGHAGAATDATFLPNGEAVVSGGTDGTLRFWSVPGGVETQRITTTPEQLGPVVVSPDGTRVATGNMRRIVTVFDNATGEEIRSFVGHGEDVPREGDARISGIAFTPDGKRLVSSSRDGTLRLWDVETGATLRKMTGHWSWVAGLAVSPDGTRALSAGNDQTVRLWDLGTGKEIRPLGDHRTKAVRLALSDGGRRVVSQGLDGTLARWDATTGKELGSETLPGNVSGTGISRDGRLGLTIAGSAVTVRDVATGAVVATFDGHGGPVAGWAFGSDGERVVTSSQDGTVSVWRARTGVEEGHLNQGLAATRIGLLPDGRHVWVGGADGVIREWDLETRASGERLEGHGPVLALEASVDGEVLLSAHAVSGQDAPEIVVWDLGSHGMRAHWSVRDIKRLSAFDLSPDGRLAAAASPDGWVRLLDGDSGEPRDEIDLPATLGHAVAVAFSSDGRSLGVALSRGPILVFDLESPSKPR